MSLRRIAVPLFLLIWATSPLLECLPNSSMTAAEMECCQKMAGNCDMGGGEHKCCDATVNQSAPAAAVQQNCATQELALSPAVEYAQIELAAPQFIEGFDFASVAITFSPPGFSTVLRI
ncbi:MAG TPA: hypothetical protein VKP58_07585 [Candidatus Acidoferrum sp.]|nr:hypothetical protein [Candidatus Acidoferrum sp.]